MNLSDSPKMIIMNRISPRKEQTEEKERRKEKKRDKVKGEKVSVIGIDFQVNGSS